MIDCYNEVAPNFKSSILHTDTSNTERSGSTGCGFAWLIRAWRLIRCTAVHRIRRRALFLQAI
jgi:hypothetical protein